MSRGKEKKIIGIQPQNTGVIRSVRVTLIKDFKDTLPNMNPQELDYLRKYLSLSYDNGTPFIGLMDYNGIPKLLRSKFPDNQQIYYLKGLFNNSIPSILPILHEQPPEKMDSKNRFNLSAAAEVFGTFTGTAYGAYSKITSG